MRSLRFILPLLIASTAAAAPPTNCHYPQTLQAAVAPETALPHVNETKCIVNALQQRAGQTARSEYACAAFQVSAARRKKVTLTATTALTGTEGILADVKDAISPAMLGVDGILPATGTGQIDVWIFNRDAGRTRQGTVCAEITKP